MCHSLVSKCIQKYIQGDDLNDIGDPKIVLRNWLSTLDQYVFKNSTESHFKKHGGISAVMYLLTRDKTEEENGKNEYHYKVRAIHKKDEVENAKGVLKAIFCEYKKVEKILNEHHIYFDSFWRMEEGKDEMKLVWPENPSDTTIERICL